MPLQFVTTATLTPEVALEAVELAVAERGSTYVMQDEFNTCRYYAKTEQKTGCIVGCGLAAVGVDVKAITLDGERNGTFENDGYGDDQSFYRALVNSGVTVEAEAQAILRAAQDVQDSAGTWGEALIEAQKVRLDQLRNELTFAVEPPF